MWQQTRMRTCVTAGASVSDVCNGQQNIRYRLRVILLGVLMHATLKICMYIQEYLANYLQLKAPALVVSVSVTYVTTSTACSARHARAVTATPRGTAPSAENSIRPAVTYIRMRNSDQHWLQNTH